MSSKSSISTINQSDQKLKVALLGYGTGGSLFHAPFIHASGYMSLDGVVTGNSERAKAIHERYPKTAVYKNFDQLYQSMQPDLVVITTPNDTHHDLALMALARGSHVLVDKPFALNLEQAKSMFALAKKHDRIICPFYNRRFDSDFLTLKKIIEQKCVGKILRLQSSIERYRQKPKAGGWRETTSADCGGGVLYDLGSHLIDQIICLFGAPQNLAYCKLTELRGLGVCDDATLVLAYADFDVHLSVSMVCAEPAPRFKLLGLDGAYVKDHGDNQEEMLRAGTTPGDNLFGVEQSAHWGKLSQNGQPGAPYPSERGDWMAFYDALAKSISSGAPPPVSEQDTLATIGIIEQCYK